MGHRFSILIRKGLLLAAALGLPLAGLTYPVSAATNAVPQAKISFTFDDGYASAITQAAPTLAKYGLSGTDYVTTGCVGMTTAPNSCRANEDGTYMTWEQIAALQNSYGWEIGSHTRTHPCLASNTPPECQPAVLTPAEVEQELAGSKADLSAHGIQATSFASPYGDYTPAVHAQIMQHYATHRGFADVGDNVWPYSETLLQNYPVQAGVSVEQVRAKIDAAIAGNFWLILSLHDIKVSASTDPDDYEYNTADLDAIAAYVKSKQDAGLITSTTVRQGPVSSDTNLLANSSFNSGIADGWRTDAPAAVTGNTARNGSYPDPAASVRFAAATGNIHLFSPQVAVDPAANYLIKNFVHTAAYTGGEFAFYIDEYNSSGAWISGQYKTGIRRAFVQNVNFTYKPSSASVAHASLQVIVTGGSGITAYYDNPQWFPLTAAPPTAPANLAANGTFDAGIANGWTTDGAPNIVADSGNHGSPGNPVHSVAMTAAATNKHLFSPKVAVSPGRTYSLSSYLNITAATSNEVGFYIDEYNSSGAWISGQYKTGVSGMGVRTVSFTYTPSSSGVASASLQVIITGNSGIRAYYDDVKWLQN